MATMPNRSDDLTPAGERKRKSRGVEVTKAKSEPLVELEPNPDWHPTARMLWEAGLNSGGATFYENSDLAVLHLTCDAASHWLEQGGRRSPELLRVVMQAFGTLLFTEGDRRRLRIELEKAPDDDDDWLASIMSTLDG
jgi:hypothetical protein